MTNAEVAQVDYTAACIRLDDTARDLERAGSAQMAAVYRGQAALAYRAGRAERINPEPELAPCHICHGVLRCDKEAHLEVEL